MGMVIAGKMRAVVLGVMGVRMDMGSLDARIAMVAICHVPVMLLDYMHSILFTV